MDTPTEGAMEGDTDSRTVATLERKRPYDLAIGDGNSNAGSVTSTPRKRAKYTGKLGHQDVRDFVPTGASFSSSAVPLDDVSASEGESVQLVASIKNEEVENDGFYDASEDDTPINEGRRLYIGNLSGDATVEDVRKFFSGYSIENITIPRTEDMDTQEQPSVQNGVLASGGGGTANSRHDAPNTANDEGRRLYVGNLAYVTTEENLREFFVGFSIETALIPVNPHTSRPVGYGFVEVATSVDADRAISELSGKFLLERKISVQRARKAPSGRASPSTSNFGKETTTAAPVDKDTMDCKVEISDEDPVEAEGYKPVEEVKQEVRNVMNQAEQKIVPTNWSAINTTKIRTSLGGSQSKIKLEEDEEPQKQEETQEGEEPHKEQETQKGDEFQKKYETQQQKATRIALDRLEGFRQRLSGIDPHDGPVSAYQTAQQELHAANVDYNYCLFYPLGAKFLKPPTATSRTHGRMQTATQEKRLQMWQLAEQCMKNGTLQDLRDGRIAGFSPDELNEKPGRRQHRPESWRLEQMDLQESKLVRLSTSNLEEARSTEQIKPDSSDFKASNSKANPVIDRGNMDLRQQQTCDIEETARSIQRLTESFRHVPVEGSMDEQMKAQIQEAKTDCSYCRYFPSTQDYIPLSLIKLILRGCQTEHSCVEPIVRKAAQIWKMVKQCDEDGTLQDLKNGRLDDRMQEVSPSTQAFLSSAFQAPSNDWKPRRGSDRGRGRNRGSKGLNEGNKTIAELCQNVAEMIEDPNADSTTKSPRGTVALPPEPNATTHEPCDNSESDGDVMLNLQDIESAAESQAGVSEADNNGDFKDSDSEVESESQSDGDAMMGYSNSEQVTEKGAKHQPRPSSSNRNASILAELSSQDLNAQLRYFHVTKTSQEVDPNTPVRCMVCAQYGHMAEVCELLSCTTCGAYNQHITQNCPNSAKCSKCREQGHDKQHCPYKLKNIAQSEIVCDLCQQNGHAEEDCELFWRTSGRPWESNLSRNNVPLSCYECGHSGHLGNDCPTRRPGKSMGTSTWGPGKGQLLIKSKGEMSIKGRAQDPINLDDSEDELALFHRPKVPGPTRKGQIRINTAPKNPMPKNPMVKQTHLTKMTIERIGVDKRDQDQRRIITGPATDALFLLSTATPDGITVLIGTNTKHHVRRGVQLDMESYTDLCQALVIRHGANTDCDYCDVYLTHDSMSVRKAHNSGRNHERNVLDYYQQIGHEKAQSVIDSITSSYAAEGQAGANPMLAPQGGPPMGGQGFPPPPFGFPGGIPPPPFGMPGGPQGGPPPGFIPPPSGRGMPPFPFPPSGSPNNNGPPTNMPFPPPGGMPPNFQGFPPPMGQGGPRMSPPPNIQGGGPFGPPQGGPGGFQGGR
ncbi:hypothetical protein OEA41_002699 [Lepraria neglecta]|uniref:U1 small nuclear ribonucleoprotein C n=1 Tax=Lepraria neglecta TaxID=209136 RepID=A0AAD9Z747_9LECA|nr:hypothetical protein OEA41_002699 [Lepraria neglecta]